MIRNFGFLFKYDLNIYRLYKIFYYISVNLHKEKFKNLAKFLRQLCSIEAILQASQQYFLQMFLLCYVQALNHKW